MWQHCWKSPFITEVFCLLLILGLVVFIKAAYYSGYEVGRANLAYQENNFNEAIIHYERAIKWYTPFSRSVSHAVERLWKIGNEAEKHNQPDLALEAYRALRGSLHAIVGLNRPHKTWIPKAEERIAALMLTIETSHPHQLKRLPAERDRERFAALFRRKETLNQGGVILTEIGFLGWICTTIGFIWYGFGDNGRWIWRRSLVWGSGIAIFFTAWIIGMLQA